MNDARLNGPIGNDLPGGNSTPLNNGLATANNTHAATGSSVNHSSLGNSSLNGSSLGHSSLGNSSIGNSTAGNSSLNGHRNSSTENNGDALNTMDDIEVMLANLSNQLDAMLTQGKN